MVRKLCGTGFQKPKIGKMKKILQILFEYKTLTREQAREVLTGISRSLYNDSEITSFITVFLMRTITIEELQGFRDALMELAVKVDLEEYDLIDIVGTGGDGKNTFNISTLASFIVAGAGQKVAKHGNYGATSISGASNVMEQLGYKLSNVPGKLKKELEEAGLCFLHAPLFHPALKTVGAIRKNLGIRTFFNMLGPLVNPANPRFQLIGVYNLEMARLYTYMLQDSDSSFTIIHSLDGYDEISLTGDARVIGNDGERVMTPEQLGKRMVSAADIYGGSSTEEAAKIFLDILKGKGSWAQNAVVLANAAMALYCTSTYSSYDLAYQTAVESLESGKALSCLNNLISLQ
jgi:anthranilate phosphoribosyltransferase